MIEVLVNGKKKAFPGKMKLDELVGEVYPEGEVLELVEINGKEVTASEMSDILVKDGERVVLKFVPIEESISNIAKSALEFLDWIDSQKLEEESIFSSLAKITAGFEVMENAIFSIRSTGTIVEREEERKRRIELFEEINSLTVLEKDVEVAEKLKEVAALYRKIFSRLLEGGLENG